MTTDRALVDAPRDTRHIGAAHRLAAAADAARPAPSRPAEKEWRLDAPGQPS